MATNALPPVPHQAPMVDKIGIPTPVWSDWFKQVFSRVGGHLGEAEPVWGSAKAASGYLLTPEGIMIQWGITSSLSSATTTSIAYATNFPTACLQVLIGIRNNAAEATTDTGHPGTGNYTISTFDLYNRTSAAQVFNWIAIGY